MAVDATYNLPDTLTEGGVPSQVTITLTITEPSSVTNFQFRPGDVFNRQFEFSSDGSNWTTEGVLLSQGLLGAGTYPFVAYIRAIDDGRVEGTHSGVAQLIAFAVVDGNFRDVFNVFRSITILDRVPNAAPTDITLSANAIPENVVVGTGVKIGDITITDPNPSGNNNILSLEGADAASFAIVNGRELFYIGSSPDFESKPSYSLTLKSTDANGGTPLVFSKAFTVTVTDLVENTAPTDLTLSLSSIDENVAAGATVGSFSTTDAQGGSFTYALVSGSDSTDNSTFTIDGNQLKINTSPNFETKSSYSIRVKTTDAGGLSYEKALTIGINNVNEVPSATGKTVSTSQNTAVTVDLSDNLSDPDANGLTGATLNVTSSTGGTTRIDPNTRQVTFTPTTDFSGTASFQYTLTDAGGLASNVATVTIAVTPTPAPTDGELGTALPPIRFKGGQTGLRRQGTNRNDTLRGSFKNDILLGLGGNDRLLSGSKNRRFGEDRLLGGAGDDLLVSGAGNDLLDGGSGNDRLKAGRGNDLLLGGDGNDRLQGDEGDDVLVGGAGTDTCRGGAGRDTFVFNSPTEGTDVIQDFEGTADLIDLRSIFAQAAFGGATPFARYSQFVRLEQVGSDTAVKIDADGSGAGSDFTTLITLSNVALSNVSSKNFVIS